jgi:hypothetical protein
MPHVSSVPDVPRQKIAVGARHRSFLETHFQPQKQASTLLNAAFYRMFGCEINNFLWLDPQPCQVSQL